MAPPHPAGKKKAGTKNPPIFSQEYLIQNHGDIACGILMILALGTVVHASAPYCAAFFGPRHNVTSLEPQTISSSTPYAPPQFTYGYKDLAMLFAYTLACITAHAIWQEYVLDKLHKKLHLSKSKNAKFFESGQLILFYAVSVTWAVMLMKEEGYLRSGLSYLWLDYPYVGMSTWTKLYFIIQLSYWIHNFPELYLQKVRKEEMPNRIVYTSLYLITIFYAYLTRFWRVSLVLLTIHYIIEIFYHASRLAHFYSTLKTGNVPAQQAANQLFTAWNVIFVVGRLLSVVVAWLTFWFGLRATSIPKITFAVMPTLDVNGTAITGGEQTIVSNFNTPTIRLFTLGVTWLLQLWLVWSFIQFHMRRRRELRGSRVAAAASSSTSPRATKTKSKAGSSSLVNGQTGSGDDTKVKAH